METPNLAVGSQHTSLEERLAQIWRATLHVEAIGAEDNFFTLGGDSMMMMLVLSRVREEFGVQLDARQLSELPTLRRLGELISNARTAAEGRIKGVI